MLTRIKITLILLALIIIAGCREQVDWEFPEFSPTPTLNGILVNGEPIQVHLSLADKYDNRPLGVTSSAEVRLLVNDQFHEHLTHEGNGIYRSTLKAQPLNKYQIEASISGYATVTSYFILPQSTTIISIEQTNIAGIDGDGISYPSISITFHTNPRERQYYEVVLLMHKYDYLSRVHTLYLTDPVLLSEGIPILVFSNQIITEEEYTMRIDYSTGVTSHEPNKGWERVLYPLTVELRSVSFDYYKYLKSLYLYDEGQNAGGVTPKPLHSNVEGGYGIFAGYSSVMSETIYPDGYTGNNENNENTEDTD